MALLAVGSHIAFPKLKLFHSDKRHTFRKAVFVNDASVTTFNARDMSGVTVEVQEDSQRSLEVTLGDAQKLFFSLLFPHFETACSYKIACILVYATFCYVKQTY
uniref:Uncharacterized protein n=1 Tax=Rhipicephalus zambeziensis TaxID=60191 RepID=A0A224YG92_9ACAR